MKPSADYTAFAGDRRVATGELKTVLSALKRELDSGRHETILTFVDSTGQEVDFDLRGTLDEVLERHHAADRKPGPGRPRLGVQSREVSLLPRHWEWLAEQPRGASAILRELVEEAADREDGVARARRAAAATGRVMTTLAGDRPNFEEAYRALERREGQRFAELISEWPHDVHEYLLGLAEPAFEVTAGRSRAGASPTGTTPTGTS